jgi:hypothetical protein
MACGCAHIPCAPLPPQLLVMRHAMADVLRRPPPGTEDVVRAHFRLLRHRLAGTMARWVRGAPNQELRAKLDEQARAARVARQHGAGGSMALEAAWRWRRAECGLGGAWSCLSPYPCCCVQCTMSSSSAGCHCAGDDGGVVRLPLWEQPGARARARARALAPAVHAGPGRAKTRPPTYLTSLYGPSVPHARWHIGQERGL